MDGKSIVSLLVTTMEDAPGSVREHLAVSRYAAVPTRNYSFHE
jgi:hypothetical protein